MADIDEQKENGKVKGATVFSVIMLVCGLFMIFVSLTTTGASVNSVSGLFITLFSLLSLSNPYITYDSEGFKKKNLLGMTLKTYRFSEENITTKNNDVYVNGKKVKLGKSVLKKSEYQNFIEHVSKNTDNQQVSHQKADEDLLDAE